MTAVKLAERVKSGDYEEEHEAIATFYTSSLKYRLSSFP